VRVRVRVCVRACVRAHETPTVLPDASGSLAIMLFS
jgi:hypothetical protein